MNWLIIIITGILAIALIVFLIVRNKKDKRKFKKQLNNDYPKPRSEDGDIEINELTDNAH